MGMESSIRISSEQLAILKKELKAYPEDSMLVYGKDKIVVIFHEDEIYKARFIPDARTILHKDIEKLILLVYYELMDFIHE